VLRSALFCARSERSELLSKWIIGMCALLAMSVCAEAGSWIGKASYYGGRGRTASGRHIGAFTCAHRSLPFGSRVRVTNLANNRSVVLTVNDRGPFVRGRVIDVSTAAAQNLGFRMAGVAKVRVDTAD
jgi:rare lipoprotein A